MSEPTALENSIEGRDDAPELWLLRTQQASRLPPAVFGVVCGVLVTTIIMSPAIFTPVADLADVVASALFFGLSIGVLTGFTPYIFRGAVRDFRELLPVLDISESERARIEKGLTRFAMPTMWTMTGLGALFGVGHSALLGLGALGGLVGTTQAFGTTMLWITMFWTIPPLLANADVFSLLGSRARPELTRPDRLAPFGATAMRPTLFVIAMLCAYPVLVLSTGQDFIGPSLIGFVASFASMFGLFFLPLRGIRRKIRETRKADLAEIDWRIDSLGKPSLDELERLRDLETLLVLRARVASAPTWPLDLAGLRRFLLYVVLPPLTWAAAAIVEMLIDQQL